jgi:hypothetical protein
MDENCNHMLIVDGREVGRFWGKVSVGAETDCWEWVGAVGVGGYGKFSLRGMMVSAHRAAWIFANNKDIPKDIQVRHLCDNTICCNPLHLCLGAHADNMRDRYSQPGATKLTGETVRRIRALAATGISARRISSKTGVSRTHVRGIIARKYWSWLE